MEMKTRMQKRLWNIPAPGVVLIVVGILLGIFFNLRVFCTYNRAEELVGQERYAEASDLLRSIYGSGKTRHSNYKDTKPLLIFCDSHLAYDRGDIEEAFEQFDISQLEKTLHYQTEEQMQIVAEYCARVEAEYKPIAEEKARKQEMELLAEIGFDVPYVGMPEKYIAHTILGVPSPDVTTTTEYINWHNYTTTTYRFYEGKRFIFSAKCAKGKVISVWDRRDDPVPSGYSGWSESGSKPDPYNASSYRTAESFYDAHYEEFFCFEDAASYYYEHRND